MELATVTELVRGVPWMSPEQGAIVYRHIRETAPDLVLELGTAQGASAAYMAAALHANGKGRLVTVDREGAGYAPGRLLEDVGLREWVDLVVRDDSSYDWFLKEQIDRHSDAAGNCEPIYDLCYLDGAHNWTIDGLAVFLVEKLLKPEGWLLLDDLEWSYASSPSAASEPFPMSSSERREPHIRAVFDLLVRQHPSFTQCRVENGNWGWAQKAPGQPRRYELATSRTFAGIVASSAWKLARWGSTTVGDLRRRKATKAR
jgi:predicted O-methyltransferase YrrM